MSWFSLTGAATACMGSRSVFDDFASWSGLEMNPSKTELFTSGLDQGESIAISRYGFTSSALPIRYLGLPLMSRKLKIGEYAPLINKITLSFQSWNAPFGPSRAVNYRLLGLEKATEAPRSGSSVLQSVARSSTTWNILRPRQEEVDWHDVVWFKGAIPKHSFTMWVANYDRLLTRSRLAAWGMAIAMDCPFCSRSIETRDHLFLRCEYNLDVWREVFIRCHPPVSNLYGLVRTLILDKSCWGLQS
ncbi:uncharacterized protein LOC106403308 [Brassica napus]|uniref:uncharacterized protein LOC106403308 n=1 Tax=Brassica napus TaxID=3708 RepID=UPI0006AB6FE6|nr:uncharacterized protein LOC106403308 [Brassica napus]